jgi:hypothetical protein
VVRGIRNNFHLSIGLTARAPGCRTMLPGATLDACTISEPARSEWTLAK